MKNLTVYIADADVSFAKEMILRINAQKGMQIIGHARTGSVALNDLWQLAPDVLLLDLQLARSLIELLDTILYLCDFYNHIQNVQFFQFCLFALVIDYLDL